MVVTCILTGHVIIHIPPPTSKNLGGAEILSQDVEGWENDQDPDVNKFILLSLQKCRTNKGPGQFWNSSEGSDIFVVSVVGAVPKMSESNTNPGQLA